MLCEVETDVHLYKAYSVIGYQSPEREKKCTFILPLTSALFGGGCSTPRPGRFTPRKDPLLNVEEAGWASGPVWTCAENFSPIGIRSPYLPVRS